MLHKKTVEPDTLELLKELMQFPTLDKFILVGGTALALQIGHRISVDLDFFTKQNFDSRELGELLGKTFGMTVDRLKNNTLAGQIKGVKIDFLTHDYRDVNPVLSLDNIRFASTKDIAAMKLNAIVGNGTRLKDFVDIAYLSSSMCLREMIESYEKKYSTSNPMMPLKALAYHKDINLEEPIILLEEEKINWPSVEKRIYKMIKYPDQIFTSFSMNEAKEKGKIRGRENRKESDTDSSL
jgi:hypothetical protein